MHGRAGGRCHDAVADLHVEAVPALLELRCVVEAQLDVAAGQRQVADLVIRVAGIAVGDQLEVFKKLSWKIVIVSFVVMASTYFGSAAISNIILSLKGMI